MVLMPRVCWNWAETAALGAEREAALMAETKVRFWVGAAANCLAALRKAREACLEAIVNVRRVCEGILMGRYGGQSTLYGTRLAMCGVDFLSKLQPNSGLEHAIGDAAGSPRPITARVAG